MDSQQQQRLRDEAQLVQRCADYYQRRLERAIVVLNHAPTSDGERESLRLCVEVVHTLLASQSRLCEAIGKTAPTSVPARHAA